MEIGGDKFRLKRFVLCHFCFDNKNGDGDDKDDNSNY